MGASWAASGSAASSSSREVILASWIHVSDLHFGHGAVGHQWNQVRVLRELLADARSLTKDGAVPRPDFIFVTGDVVFSGGARAPATGGSEYQLAADWIAELQRALEIPPGHVFIVPGNHDVDRGADKQVDVRRMLQLVRSGGETIDEILHEPRDRERLRGRMARYLAFAQGFGTADDRLHDGLWWRRRVKLEEGVSMRLCGLNTALLAADEHDQGRLRVGERQLAELFGPASDGRELIVALSHHPATGSWLADEKEVRGQLDRHGAIHLFGHLHVADSEQTKHSWGGGSLRIAAGAAHAEAGAGDASPIAHGYNFGALVVLASGDLAVRIWPRRWSTSAPRFVVDVDNTGERRDFAEHRLPDRYRIQRPERRPGLHPGDVLGDRYRLVADVGQGGVGQVWRAIDQKTGDTVAVKVLNPDGARSDPDRREAFFRGAQAMARLGHPAIARVRDPRPDPENSQGPYDFYVMDFIDAPNLSAAVRGAPCSDAETIEVLTALAEGLAEAHRRQIVHRDLKPSNILRDAQTKRVVIVDFDTVKDLGDLTMTRSGGRLASALYASPEVLMDLSPPRGGKPPPVDARADIFSLAVIGVFLRTGGDPPHYYINRMSELVAAIECAPGLRAVLAKGCAFRPDERYASADELVASLRQAKTTDDTALKVPRSAAGTAPTSTPPFDRAADPPPWVFISYSRESPEHSDAVLALADRLRGEGVDAWIDRYVVSPPEGWPGWMRHQLVHARFILVICTATYRQRYEGIRDARPEEPGLGVAWEGLIAAQLLYGERSQNHRFIPILLPGSGPGDIPVELRGSTPYRLPDEYDELYRRLLGEERGPPPIGARRPPVAPQPAVSEGVLGGWLSHKLVGGDVSNRGAAKVVRELSMFLSAAFEEGELRRLAFFHGGPELDGALPGSTASRNEVAFMLAKALWQRRLLDDNFFADLAQHRPTRADEVGALRQAAVEVTTPGAHSVVSTPSTSTTTSDSAWSPPTAPPETAKSDNVHEEPWSAKDSAELEPLLVEVLKDARTLTAALDTRLAEVAPVGPPPANIIERVARRILALGRGITAAERLVEACFAVVRAERAPAAADAPAARDLVERWLPRGYGGSGRVSVVTLRAAEGVTVDTLSPVIVEAHVAHLEGRAARYATRASVEGRARLPTRIKSSEILGGESVARSIFHHATRRYKLVRRENEGLQLNELLAEFDVLHEEGRPRHYVVFTDEERCEETFVDLAEHLDKLFNHHERYKTKGLFLRVVVMAAEPKKGAPIPEHLEAEGRLLRRLERLLDGPVEPDEDPV